MKTTEPQPPKVGQKTLFSNEKLARCLLEVHLLWIGSRAAVSQSAALINIQEAERRFLRKSSFLRHNFSKEKLLRIEPERSDSNLNPILPLTRTALIPFFFQIQLLSSILEYRVAAFFVATIFDEKMIAAAAAATLAPLTRKAAARHGRKSKWLLQRWPAAWLLKMIHVYM